MVVISDSPMFDRGMPSICYGLRGLAYFQIDCAARKATCTRARSAARWPIPAIVLAQVLAQMKDRGGRIKIPGFYDDVRELSEAERAEWKKLPFNETRYRKELGAPKLFGEIGLQHARACVGAADVRGQRPAVRLHRRRREDRAAGDGDGEGEHAAGARTRIRRRSPISSRRTCGRSCPKTVELKVTRMHGGKPWMTEFDNKFVRAAGRAIEQGFGKAPVFNREGGSIPVVSTFQRELGHAERALRRRPARRERARAG